MPDMKLLLEAERRGILPPEKATLLQEARRRGLVPASPDAGTTPGPSPSMPTPTRSTSPAGPVLAGAQSAGGGPGASEANLRGLARRVNPQLQRRLPGEVAEPVGEQSNVALAGGFLGDMARNTPASAAQFARDITAPIHSPVETVKGLAGLARGLVQMLRPGEQGDEGKVRAVGQFLADRYGGLEEISNTLRTDPVGVAGDIAGILTGGAGLAAKAAGTAGRVGRVATAAGKAGRAIEPSALAGRAVAGVGRGAGRAAAEVLGMTTGATSTPIRRAVQAGREGGRLAETFMDHARGRAPADQVVEQARDALRVMHERKMGEYRQGIGAAFADTADTPLNFDQIAEAMQNATAGGQFKGVDIAGSTAQVREKLTDLFAKWERLDPAEFHTVEGMDALRKAVGDVMETTEFGTPARRVANQVYHAVREAVAEQAPGYARTLSDYHEATKHLRDLEKELSLGNKAAAATALRKLQAVMRKDVASAYGQRADYAKELDRAGARGLHEALAGQALSEWAPRGLARGVGAGAAGYGAMTLNPSVLPLLAASSPRIVGEAAFRLGQAQGALAPLMVPPPVGARAGLYQAGRAERVSR